MTGLFDFIKRHSGPVAWIFALIVGILLSQTPREFKSKISGVFINSVYGPITNVGKTFRILKDRREENLRLKEELIACHIKVDNLKEASRENQRLREALEFSRKLNYYTILAEVTGRGTPRISGSIVVNVGASKGVIVGLPVINADGVVGRISNVYDKSSIVQLLSDPNMRVSAIDARSRVQGIVSADHQNQVFFENVPVDADVRKGDAVISSGLGGSFPKGLLIGQVVRISQPQFGLFSTVEIDPAANLQTVEEVFILFSEIDTTYPGDQQERDDG